MKNKLTHTDSRGKAMMVDVSDKQSTLRIAEAYGCVKVSNEVLKAIKSNSLKKGDVLTTAKISGIQAAKKTSGLIPLCHNIFISKIDVDITLNTKSTQVEIRSFAKTTSQTGIEMEALTAVSVAALTIYDMCKALDKSMIISEIKLLTKSGGKSGDYKAKSKSYMENNSSTGRVIAISTSKHKGIQKENVQEAVLIKEHGIEGDAHAGNWHRQVSFLAVESIEKMKEKGLLKLKPGAFAENITTEFLVPPEFEIGSKLKIGNNALLEITQIGKECHSRCAIFHTVGDCVMPREGIFAKVIEGGCIRVGDEIRHL